MKQILLAAAVAGIVAMPGGCSQPTRTEARSAVARCELSTSSALAAAPRARRAETRTDAPDEYSTWLALGLAMGDGTARADAAPGPGQYTPWRDRRGAAYAGEVWRSFGRDVKELPATIWDDTVATAKNPLSLGLLVATAVTGITLSGTNGNDQVERHFTRNSSQLNTFWDTVGDVGGNPGMHFAVAGAMYFTSLARSDIKTYEVSKTLINALAINGLVTLGLKGLVRTESPNGDEFGWPSGHTSSTFTFATVMYEAYGPWVGIPLFAFASYVGYERIDARNHDFSDVISGALIGIAIGHAVAQNHKMKIFGMDVVPYTDPSRGAVGVALTKQW